MFVAFFTNKKKKKIDKENNENSVKRKVKMH